MAQVLKATKSDRGMVYLITEEAEEKAKKVDLGFYRITAGSGNGLPANVGVNDIIYVPNELDLKQDSAVRKLSLRETLFVKSFSLNFEKEEETVKVWGSDVALAVGSSTAVGSGSLGGIWVSDSSVYQELSGQFIKTVDMTDAAPKKTEASGETKFILFGKNTLSAKGGEVLVYYYLPVKINSLSEPQEEGNVIEVSMEFTVDGAFKPMKLLIKK